MFCKVCFDASKSDYKTHNVKDSASNVVCPLLLNTKCHKCGYFGHTTKYCKLTSSPIASKAYVRPPIKVQVVVSVPVSIPKKRVLLLAWKTWMRTFAKMLMNSLVRAKLRSLILTRRTSVGELD